MDSVQRSLADGGGGNGSQNRILDQQSGVMANGMTDYRNTWIFGGSNQKISTTGTQRTPGKGRGFLSSELHRHVRPRGHVRAGQWRLLARHAAANRFQFKTSVLSRFDGTADSFSNERRHFDPPLLDVQHHGTGSRDFCLKCSGVGNVFISCGP
jgi:hypothetical protein